MQTTSDKILLIGGRGSGKSTIGKQLAARVGMDFLDMDTLLENRAGKPISKLVEEKGWPYFRELEQKLLEELLPKDNQVVATGGGAILHQQIWPQLMANSFIVWLKASLETTRARIVADSKSSLQRPSLTGEDISKETERILTERNPLYKKGSHIEISAEQSVEAIVETIEREYRRNQEKYLRRAE